MRSSVSNDFDAATKLLREHPALPLGRTDSGSGSLEAQQTCGVLDPHSKRVVEAGRKFRVEPDVGALRVVVELAVEREARLGKNVAQEQRLAPSRVSVDHVGHEAVLLQLQARAHHCLPAAHRAFERPHVVMGARGGRRRRRIPNEIYARNFRTMFDVIEVAQCDNLAAGGLGERSGEVPVLGREILVDEKDSHCFRIPSV